ncbi:hypothetical protein DFH09DRAFT_1338570 [Mycena vulgaris]|nr:hypothetical protein DFH09DRAFT_1338570 [Mycena vulgaris]
MARATSRAPSAAMSRACFCSRRNAFLLVPATAGDVCDAGGQSAGFEFLMQREGEPRESKDDAGCTSADEITVVFKEKSALGGGYGGEKGLAVGEEARENRMSEG